MLVDSGTLKGLNVLAALIILAREILVSGLREFLAELKIGVPVSQLAKWKTGAQMGAITILLLGDAVPPVIGQIGLVLIWVAAALTLITGYDYLRTGLRHMAEGGRREADMKVRYFAWMKRTVGVADEEVAPPAEVQDGRRSRGLAARPQHRPRRGAGRGRCLRRGGRPAHRDLRRADRRRARGRVLPALHGGLT